MPIISRIYKKLHVLDGYDGLDIAIINTVSKCDMYKSGLELSKLNYLIPI